MIFLYLRGLFPTITFYGRSKALKIRKMNILLHIAQKQHKNRIFKVSICPVCHMSRCPVLSRSAGNWGVF